MRIAVGQDAKGRWAWMIVDDAERCVASDDDYHEAALAMEDALAQLHVVQRSQRRHYGR